MSSISYDFPLKWPQDRRPTVSTHRGYPKAIKRDLTITEAIGFLEEEIHALAPQSARVFTDYEHLQVDRLRKRIGNNPGVSIEMKLDGKHYLLACDLWALVEHNLYILHLTLRYYRQLSEWGVGNIHQLLQSFAEGSNVMQLLHATADELPQWMQQLGLGPTATLEDAHATYRRRAKLVADNEQELMLLNNAMDEARKHLH